MLTRKTLCLLLALCALSLPAGAEEGDARALLPADHPYSGQVLVPGRGVLRYYAQNDPSWGLMTFRFPHQTVQPRFSGAGCVPTALANCIANLAEPEQLNALDAFSYRGRGFSVCPCSMNRLDCDRTHSRFRLTTARDFEEFFCLALGSYLSGNNPEEEYACGTLYMAPQLFQIYGLPFFQAGQDIALAAREVARNGALAVMLVGGPDCPYTTGGHALVLCAADDACYYFLDSFRRDAYPLDQKGTVRVVTPGVTAVPRERALDLGAYQIYVVYPRPAQTAQTP